jgi:microcystin-dependent protein
MSEAFMGEIRPFVGNYAPVNWHLCDGTSLSVSEYQALFSLLGTQYGGDGTTTFNLPDLRGRVPVHAGQGIGLTNHVTGANGGTETVTLSLAQLPAHSHTVAVVANSVANSQNPANAYFSAVPSPYVAYVSSTDMAAQNTLDSRVVQSCGNNQSHNNMMPSVVLTYIICIVGLYPTRG